MIAFGGKMYYVDFDTLDVFITTQEGGKDKTSKEVEIKEIIENGVVIRTEKYQRITPQSKEIDAAKYDIVKTFIEYLIDFDGGEDEDDSLGFERAMNQTPLGYRIVFNTLLNQGIIKEAENED